MGKSAVQDRPKAKESAAAVADPTADIEVGRGRLRFSEFEFDCAPDGSCVASIVLEWEAGERFRGWAEGTQTPQGELRCGATAAVAAANKASGGAITFSLAGVKAVRAFDSWVIIVAIRGKEEDQDHQLIGAYATPNDQSARAAAMSVLDATNRVLVKHLNSIKK